MVKINLSRQLGKSRLFPIFPFPSLYRLITRNILVILSLSPCSLWAQGGQFELVGGLGAVSEGDDRLRPAVVLRGSDGGHWYGQGVLWGRRFAQVEERTLLLSGGYRTEVFNTDWLQAAAGVVAMEERTTVHPRGAQTNTDAQSSYNFGGTLGMHGVWSFNNRFLVEAAWESAIFPAGASVILLTTGRKQTLSLGAGARF